MKFSISQIKNFKTCRRSYFFRYIEELEPVQKAEPLETGSSYHEFLETLYRDGNLNAVEEPTKALAMAKAYETYIYPFLAVKAVEEPFTFVICNDYELIGRVDGIAEDGNLVEHKTTSKDLEQFEYDLQWDEQLMAYMLAYDVRKVYYTVVKKPTIRLKKNETDEEFYQRMVEWYDIDTHEKIRLIEVERTDEEIEQFRDELCDICYEIERASTHPKRLYKNCLWCNNFGRRCEYSSICLNYDPNETYIEFEKVERRKDVQM
jgi:hypothetical protein